MSSSAVELLIELSQDPFRAQQILNRPESLLEEGLTSEEAGLLAGGDSAAILRHLGQGSIELMVQNPDDDDDDDDEDDDDDDYEDEDED